MIINILKYCLRYKFVLTILHADVFNTIYSWNVKYTQQVYEAAIYFFYSAYITYRIYQSLV